MNNKIVITTDGKTTTAVQYDGKQRVAEAKAACCPDDKFDFMTGAEIALKRLDLHNILGNHFRWVVVHRKPKVGDHVRLKCDGHFSFSRAGDILPVDECFDDIIGVLGSHHPRPTCSPNGYWPYAAHEFEVVELVVNGFKKAKLYNGKVVCVRNSRTNVDLYTPGKIYEFQDGVIITDDGHQMPRGAAEPIETFADWVMYSSSEWLEVVE